MSLAPLVVVAWADGKLEDREREAILTADTIARRLLAHALARQPDPRLLPLWKTYVGALWSAP